MAEVTVKLVKPCGQRPRSIVIRRATRLAERKLLIHRLDGVAHLVLAVQTVFGGVNTINTLPTY